MESKECWADFIQAVVVEKYKACSSAEGDAISVAWWCAHSMQEFWQQVVNDGSAA